MEMAADAAISFVWRYREIPGGDRRTVRETR
jgi:hypothetical protein